MTVGIIAFAVGYYLPAEIVRIIWLTFAGIGILGGLIGFAMMCVMKNIRANVVLAGREFNECLRKYYSL